MKDALIARCYETVHKPSAWNEFLREFCDATSSMGGSIMVPPVDGFPSAPFVMHNTGPLEKILHLLPKFSSVAPFVNKAIERGKAPGVYRFSDVMSLDELDGVPGYTEYMRLADVRHGLSLFVRRGEISGRPPIMMQIGRPWGADDYGDEHVELGLELFPHFRRAVDVAMLVEATLGFDPAIAQAFDQFSTPALLFRFDGALLYANVAAKHYIHSAKTLTISGSYIHASVNRAGFAGGHFL